MFPSKKISLISALLLSFAVIAFTGFLLINTIYAGLIRQGWISDVEAARQVRTEDFAQMIQQDVLNGSYTNVVYKAMRSLDQADTVALEVVLNDGYVIFSQKKQNLLSKDDVFEVKSEISPSSLLKTDATPAPIGQVIAVYRLDEIKSHIEQKQNLLYRWFGLVLFLSFLIIYFLSRRISDPIRNLSQIASLGSLKEIYDYQGTSPIVEISELEVKIKDFADQLLKIQDLIILKARDAAIGEITAQVVHDIRSPLAALDMVLSNLPNLPEDKRLIIRSAVGRIRDISNNLVGKKEIIFENNLQCHETAPYLLSSLIDNLITEKRTQYRSKLNVEIEYLLESESYGIFSLVEPIEFSRMLSNLINNAVEALDDDGKVRLRILPSGNRLNIIIEDNGRGIPEDLLSKLGQRGNTFGKVGGSGLGLHHAIKVAESFSGKVAIESEIGKGTLVIIDLPRVAAPIWFVEHLELHSSSILVVLDDDPSIHQIWQGRIDSLNSSETKIRVEHFSTPNDLRSWVRTEALEHDFIFYLLDYELLGYKETGLDMAEELHLSRNSILVTSRYEEEFIKNRCINLSMPMIPKGMAGFVPIVVKSV